MIPTPVNPSSTPALPDARKSSAMWLIPVCVGLLVLLFAIITRSVWEDYYITFLSSQNLVDGNGLVYHPGERLHTFTSPLGVLLPALTYAITGTPDGALWLFRILSAAALGTAAWIVLSMLAEEKWARVGAVLAVVLGLTQVKTIEFSSNGMETAFLALFTVLTLRELTRADGIRIAYLAGAYAALMWTRPDAFIVAGGLTGGALLFTTTDKRKALLRPIMISILVGVALYLPWLIWAWSYYGSPIPQTIIAKAALSPGRGLDLARVIAAPLRALTDYTPATETFAPTYHQGQAWGRDCEAVWALFARAACFVWLWPRLPRVARIASFTFLIGVLYLQQILPYPWYYAPWTALGGIALAGLCHRGWRATHPALRVAMAVAIAFGFFVFVAGVLTARNRQALVEEPVRKQIGLWLHEHARQDDTVFLEPIGYIGYYSAPKVKLLDFPGLTSREVSSAIRAGAKNYTELINRLEPVWLVLRPQEIRDQRLRDHGLLDVYDLRAKFTNFDSVLQAPLIPGRGVLLFDAEFLIFERKRPPALP